MKSRILVTCMLYLLIYPATSLRAVSLSEMARDQLTVRELMQLENEQALQAQRRRKSPAAAALAPDAGQGVASGDVSLRLVGIYGVGKRLFAEVRRGTHAFVFLKGHSRPVGHTLGAADYRLKALTGACVQLEHHGEETVLCLPGGSGR